MSDVMIYEGRRFGGWTALRERLARGLNRAAAERWRQAYLAWRRERDVDAIARALDRLSDRRLALIGMDRASLRGDAEALVERTEACLAAARETLDLLEGPRSVARLPAPSARGAAQAAA